MFDLKKKTEYGLQLMMALAKRYSQGPLSLRQLAKEEKLPYKFLEQLVLPLRIAGFLEAKEGKAGGYFLTKPPAKISVSQVVEALEGPMDLGHCLGCSKAGTCGQKDIWSEVGEKIRQAMKGKTLKDLI
jgi:Rrf2 family transcriptional regulator, cysteine metabolism repressor